MNILYVSGMPGPLRSVLRGEDKIQGLPAFYFPWKMPVGRGHIVDFVVLSIFNEPYNSKADWFSADRMIKNIYAPHTEKAVRKKHYDFIYCNAFEKGDGAYAERQVQYRSSGI